MVAIGILDLDIKKVARTNYFIKLKEEFAFKGGQELLDNLNSTLDNVQ
ncbi:MAG: hypothetical protein GF364_15600 [Candidatus Lokiarchaeota archaeon]|nr:hypothetical protein [Candidatus Lokiarchaeota archaeon]